MKRDRKIWNRPARVLLATTSLAALGFGAASEQPFRLQAIDAAAAPRITAILDSREGMPKPLARPVLTPAEFKLRVAGVAVDSPVRAVPFRDTRLGIALIVALDASRSMSGRPMAAIRQGLANLVSRKRDQDRIAVISFANDVRWETRWDSSTQDVRTVLENLTVRGNRTCLRDALAAAIDEITKQRVADPGFPPRSAILVISDGQDAGSKLGLASLLTKVNTAKVRVDAVGLSNPPVRFDALHRITTAGFGILRPASTPESLTALIEDGIDSMLDAPVLEFESSAFSMDGKIQQLGVEHKPSGWHEDLDATVPLATWRKPLVIAILAGGALIAIALIAVASLRFRRGPSGPPVPQSVAQAGRGATMPAHRLPTEVEPLTVHPIALQLAVIAGPYSGHRFELPVGEFWIGARDNNHLCLAADPAVSGNHACIRFEAGVFRVYDNGSLNDTYVNGQPIGRSPASLNAGDRLRIGMSEILLEASSSVPGRHV